jgi:hypothetical protein
VASFHVKVYQWKPLPAVGISQCQHLGDSIDHGPSSPLMQRFNGEQPAVLPSAGTVVLMLVATILLTPFLNNAATVLVMAPIAASLARQ